MHMQWVGYAQLVERTAQGAQDIPGTDRIVGMDIIDVKGPLIELEGTDSPD